MMFSFSAHAASTYGDCAYGDATYGGDCTTAEEASAPLDSGMVIGSGPLAPSLTAPAIASSTARSAPAATSTPPVATTTAPAIPTYAFSRDLELGMTGEDVRQLQMALNARGFTVAASGAGAPGSETTFFGRATRAALARFQAAHEISPAVGYFGPKTRAALQSGRAAPSVHAPVEETAEPTFTRDLAIGMTGEDVRALQRYLNASGYVLAEAGEPGSPGHETDRFGAATYRALITFQTDAGITPTSGYFGPKTRAYIATH